MARTGVEYPMMRDLGHPPFLAHQKEFEPLVERPIHASVLEEHIRNDADRSVNCAANVTFPVVYDYLESSPYYDGDGGRHGPYMDEKHLIELPNPSE